MCDHCGNPSDDLQQMTCYSLHERKVDICPPCRKGYIGEFPCPCDCDVNQNPRCTHTRKFPMESCRCGWCHKLRSDRVDGWLDLGLGEEEKLTRFFKEIEGLAQ